VAKVDRRTTSGVSSARISAFPETNGLKAKS
jgi:hypothetical protein